MIGDMADLLRTKLFIPPLPSEVLPRPHLVEQLNHGMTQKLSLVIAPAGYGKTTLVITWLHQLSTSTPPPQVVWLSLDEGDNDLRRFFTYFVAALAHLDEPFLGIQDAFLQDSSGEIATVALVTSLVNQVVAQDQSIIFILDDYHKITEAGIHEALSFWLDNQPPNFHLGITSRVEPPLPLPRMRVRRQVTEIETEALRFSRRESTDFLNQHMHLNLSANDIAQLDSMTEGWVASLQLAALSLQNKDDPSAFIQAFKGDHRYIVDYFVNEVLHRQPGYIRDFLLQTSILERLNVQLCNAVTEQVGSQHILETLDQTRLFVIPLDDRRHWYRYHHLFADCLHAELRRTAPEKMPIYHERASQWFSNHGFLGEAIQHAFAAENSTLAADLMATNAYTMLWEQGEMHRLWQWMQQLPAAAIQTRPHLLMTKVWLYEELFLDYGYRVDAWLDEASTLIHAPNAPYTPTEIAEIATEIALAHANLERLRGHLEQAIQYCNQAMALIAPIDSPRLKASALHALAITYHQAGNISQSLHYSNTQFEAHRWDKPMNYAHYVSLAYRIDALRLNGQLSQAIDVLKHIEPRLLQRQGVGAAMLAISWAEILRERNQLDQAVDILTPALETLKPLPSMAVVVQTGVITLARIFHAQGQGQEALALLKDTLQNFPASDTYYPSARISAVEALLHLRQGNRSVAQIWAETCGLQADDDPTYLLEMDYLILARILIADRAAQAAQKILGKLEQMTRDNGRLARLVEVHILQALCHQTLGDREQALSRLGQALELAESKGFVRILVDEGNLLVPLLTQTAARRGNAVAYIRQLLLLFDETILSQSPSTSKQTPIEAESDTATRLLSPLTTRELATLRYLASDLTIPEIAEQLILAPSTVRSYVKNIYHKLDVHTRLEAVNRARTLGLFD